MWQRYQIKKSFKLNFNKAHKGIQELVKHLRWNVFVKKVNGLRRLTIFSKIFIIDVLGASECASVKNKHLQQTSPSIPHFISQWEIIHVFLHFDGIIITFQPAFTCVKSTMKHQNNEWNLFKVNSKEAPTTSMASF